MNTTPPPGAPLPGHSFCHSISSTGPDPPQPTVGRVDFHLLEMSAPSSFTVIYCFNHIAAGVPVLDEETGLQWPITFHQATSLGRLPEDLDVEAGSGTCSALPRHSHCAPSGGLRQVAVM